MIQFMLEGMAEWRTLGLTVCCWSREGCPSMTHLMLEAVADCRILGVKDSPCDRLAPCLQDLVDYLTHSGASSTHVQPAALELHFAGQAQV